MVAQFFQVVSQDCDVCMSLFAFDLVGFLESFIF